MKELTMTNAQIRAMADVVVGKWSDFKGEIKLTGRQTYNLVTIKRKITELTSDINDSMMTIAERFNGDVHQDGSISFPEDVTTQVNKEIIDVMNTEVTISFNPIAISEDDNLPVDLMESLFEFIEFE